MCSHAECTNCRQMAKCLDSTTNHLQGPPCQYIVCPYSMTLGEYVRMACTPLLQSPKKPASSQLVCQVRELQQKVLRLEMEGQASLSRTDTEKELQMEVSSTGSNSRYILLYVMGFERYSILPIVFLRVYCT